jgi:hypothetical protein
MQRILFHTPLVYLFIFGSAIFHDKLWYQFKGKKIYNNWLNTTEWGALLKKY